MNYEPTERDLSEIQGQNQADIEQSLKRQSEDFEWLMSSERGRRIVRLLLAEAGVWRSSFSRDALQMAFSEGMRQQGLNLLSRVSDKQYFNLVITGEPDE